ncbi:interleukin-22 receptor subunit alpha-1 [Bombina bombina]|uniref:interleukin-22 receptor subunit alpha-1 n=1 Tax=Bombina bombina TaxID=8345 RepID=UPI00235AC33C|nr:interleukin-22 receptor subunit alpha-1 [Bombina bombina]
MEHQYYGRVRALSQYCSSEWVISNRLCPREDTHFSQPELNYIQDVHSVKIFVQAPSVQNIEEIYSNEVEYHLSLSKPEKQELLERTQDNNIFEFSGLSPDTKFNGSVYILISKEKKSETLDFVVQTLPDSLPVTLIVCAFVTSACLLGAGVIFLGYKYAKKTEKTPGSLVFGSTQAVQPMKPSMDKVISFPISNPSCLIHFTPLMPVRSPHTALDNKGQTVYNNHFQNHTTISEQVLKCSMPSSYCPQPQRNLTDYGLFEDKTELETIVKPYLTNNTISEMREYKQTHVQIEPSPVIYQSPEIPEKVDNDILWPFLNGTFLLTTVKVSDDTDNMDSETLMEQNEDPNTIMLSDTSTHDPLIDIFREEQAIEDSSLMMLIDRPYSLQCQNKNLHSETLESCTRQELYMTQHFVAD